MKSTLIIILLFTFIFVSVNKKKCGCSKNCSTPIVHMFQHLQLHLIIEHTFLVHVQVISKFPAVCQLRNLLAVRRKNVCLVSFVKRSKLVIKQTLLCSISGQGHGYMSRVIGKPDFCICENKDADQLHGNREADQRLCFCYTDSTLRLLPISEISSL